MPALTTARLTCLPLQEQDWPFFLSLQQNPDVMRFVAHERSEADIREAFVSRLLPWAPGSSHWLCLVVRETASQTPLGVTKSVFSLRPLRRGKVTALNLCGRCVISR